MYLDDGTRDFISAADEGRDRDEAAFVRHLVEPELYELEVEAEIGLRAEELGEAVEVRTDAIADDKQEESA